MKKSFRLFAVGALVASSLTAFSTGMASAQPIHSTPSFTAEPVSSFPEITDNDETWMKDYAVFSHTGTLYFDERKALSDGLSKEKVEKLKAMNEIAAAFAPETERGWGNAGEGPFRNYKFCGWGNLGWDETPYNTLDRLCMHHDLCYDDFYNSCQCDQDFINEIEEYKDDMGWLEKRQAEGAQSYFQIRALLKKCEE